jgi:hypothetical protein
MLDLLYAGTVGFPAFAIHCPLAIRHAALYQISVRHFLAFADGFLLICSRRQHLCQSLTLPSNPACAGTYTLLD